MRTNPLPEAFAYGIDIGKKVFHVVAVNRDGAVDTACQVCARDVAVILRSGTPSINRHGGLSGLAMVGLEADQFNMGHDARIIPARFV